MRWLCHKRTCSHLTARQRKPEHTWRSLRSMKQDWPRREAAALLDAQHTVALVLVAAGGWVSSRVLTLPTWDDACWGLSLTPSLPACLAAADASSRVASRVDSFICCVGTESRHPRLSDVTPRHGRRLGLVAHQRGCKARRRPLRRGAGSGSAATPKAHASLQARRAQRRSVLRRAPAARDADRVVSCGAAVSCS